MNVFVCNQIVVGVVVVAVVVIVVVVIVIVVVVVVVVASSLLSQVFVASESYFSALVAVTSSALKVSVGRRGAIVDPCLSCFRMLDGCCCVVVVVVVVVVAVRK